MLPEFLMSIELKKCVKAYSQAQITEAKHSSEPQEMCHFLRVSTVKDMAGLIGVLFLHKNEYKKIVYRVEY